MIEEKIDEIKQDEKLQQFYKDLKEMRKSTEEILKNNKAIGDEFIKKSMKYLDLNGKLMEMTKEQLKREYNIYV